jgi:hypothetical protein
MKLTEIQTMRNESQSPDPDPTDSSEELADENLSFRE